jgi:outer membrane protein OmpA-like peptidoglycan-associated protein
MKKGCTWIVAVLLLSAMGGSPVYSASNDLGLEVGIAGGVAYGLNESEDNEFKPHVRATLGTIWGQYFQTELGVGLAQNGDGEFSTNLMPIDIRLKFSPISSERTKPYLFAGFGALYFEVIDEPAGAAPYQDYADWTGIVPFGIGIQHYFSEQLAIEVSGGDNFSFSDALNPLNGDDDDSFLSAAIGLKYALKSIDKDRDKDGLTNKDEKKLYGTDPDNPDTDGDGLGDGDEINVYLTDPLKADSDDDELSDKDEVITHLTDPNKADTDADGLSDGEELLTYQTDPLIVDSDGDELGDGDEVLDYGTQPTNADTDMDALSDGAELLVHSTDPLKPDTDAGTVNDGEEVERGSDPLDPSDDVGPSRETIIAAFTFDAVLFNFGSSSILSSAEATLEKVLAALNEFPDVQLQITGYTCNTGTNEYNAKLSEKRARRIADWLIERGIAAERLLTEWQGEDNPTADNAILEEKKLNRRVEFSPILEEEE